MKFATFLFQGREAVGVISPDEQQIYPLTGVPDMIGLISAYRGESFDALSKDLPLPLTEVKLLAPIPHPRHDLICVGMNYLEHALESARFKRIEFKKSPNPLYFSKRVGRCPATGEDIPAHTNLTQELDYEAELAVVIGKRCDRVSPEDVWDYVFGYTILNDVSARDLQRGHGGQYYFGKSLDGFAPMGPWIVTADEFGPNPHLAVRSRVNGELRQNGNTREFLYDIPFLVSQLSSGFVLEPGDIIATGTPSGVGMGFQPPKFLSPGDVVECEIEGIGKLVNTIR
ncbi:MAG TPA: fumarylacetoacetate hydrolase family protein [Clostridiales bacterium]|nr:fumarylacetoacetate hydrolase family protein [Clostridiales bacterium]